MLGRKFLFIALLLLMAVCAMIAGMFSVFCEVFNYACDRIEKALERLEEEPSSRAHRAAKARKAELASARHETATKQRQ